MTQPNKEQEIKLNQKQIWLIVIWNLFLILYFSNRNFLAGLIRACISTDIALLGIYFLERKTYE